jgi:hypothetical protein
VERLEDRVTPSTAWIEQGPGPVSAPDFTSAPSTPAGAIQAIAVDPTNANVVYVGSVNGGIWKTTNATAARPHWIPLTDQALPDLSIDSLAISPVDPNTLYAGTSSLSSFSGAGSAGYGLARSRDGGSTWQVLASDALSNQRLHNIVPTRLAGGNVILVASELSGCAQTNSFLFAGGVYRSTNNGLSFTRISGAPGSGLPDQEVTDLVADPSNPSRFYAAVPLKWLTKGPFGQASPTGNEGIYRSDDGGVTWARVSAGIPGMSTAFRIFLAVHNSPGNDVVYAAVIAQGPIDLVSGDLQGVFRSTDLGATWTAMGVPSDPVFPKGQGAQFHGSFVADPSNPNVVFLGGDGAFLGGNGSSHEAGLTFRGDASLLNPWTSVVVSGANGTAPHADTRAMVFDANGNLLQSNDGGIYRLVNPDTPATRQWGSVNGDIRTVEFHSVAYDPVSNVVFGGTQDNGTITQTAPGSLSGFEFSGADGGVVAVDGDQTAHPGTSIRYTSQQDFAGFARTAVDANNVAGHPNDIRLKIVAGDGQGKKLLDYDPNIDVYQPFALNAIDPTRMLVTTHNIYESFDQGDSLNDLGSFGVAIGAPSPFIQYGRSLAYGGRLNGVANADVFYAGAASPDVFTGTGQIFHRVHAGDPVTALSAYPGGTVIGLAIDPQNYRRVYVVDQQNRVWASFDEGASWTELTANLHSLTIDTLGRSIEIYSASSSPDDDVLMVGNMGGVFAMSHPGTPGATWTVLGKGLPHVLALDLHYDYTNNVLVVGTLGRGAWTLNHPFSAGEELEAAALPQHAMADSLKLSQVQPLLGEALARWQGAGIDTSTMHGIDVRIADLGGALDIEFSSAVSVAGCSFSENQAVGGAAGGSTASGGAGLGGAISVGSAAVYGYTDTSSLSLTSSTLTGNVAQGGAGGNMGTCGDGVGGAMLVLAGDATLSNCTLACNAAIGGNGSSGGDGFGGGLFVDAHATLNLLRSTVTGNEAIGGAGATGFSDGQGTGGGLYLAPGATACANGATVIDANSASTSYDDVFGLLEPC